MKEYEKLFARMRRLSALVSHTTEQCEAIIEEMNEDFQRLEVARLLTTPVILGEPFLRGYFGNREDKEGLFQAAIVPDQGCGCVGWEVAEFDKWRRSGNLDKHAPKFFRAFKGSDAELRRLLLPQLDVLFQRFSAGIMGRNPLQGG